MMYAHEIGYDRFLAEQPSQPKLAVGDYVAANGFLVPERHATLEGGLDLLSRGKKVSTRSENFDEYAGPSGLGDSRTVAPSPTAHLELTHIAANPRLDAMNRYAVFAGMDATEYTAESSTTYWEYIPGTNVTVVADSVVPGRYHLFGVNYDAGDGDYTPPMSVGGALVDESGAIQLLTKNGYGDAVSQLPLRELIAMYEQIRNLPRFDPKHCPIIEMQVSEEAQDIYFLQYHRSRDEELGDPTLSLGDFDQRDNWFEAQHVIGAYMGKQTLQLTLAHGNSDHEAIELNGDGYIGDTAAAQQIGEIGVRQRVADISFRTYDSAYTTTANEHASRSRLFKPQTSLLVPSYTPNLDAHKKLVTEASALSFATGLNVAVEAKVVSDGYRGFIQVGQDLVVLQKEMALVV